MCSKRYCIHVEMCAHDDLMHILNRCVKLYNPIMQKVYCLELCMMYVWCCSEQIHYSTLYSIIDHECDYRVAMTTYHQNQ